MKEELNDVALEKMLDELESLKERKAPITQINREMKDIKEKIIEHCEKKKYGTKKYRIGQHTLNLQQKQYQIVTVPEEIKAKYTDYATKTVFSVKREA